MSQKSALDEAMAAYADKAVTAAAEMADIQLDYSNGSVSLLDELLQEFHEQGAGGDLAERLSILFGSYLGETLRRDLGGEWLIPSEGPFEGMACLKVGEDLCSPPYRVYKRLQNGEEDDLVSWYKFFLCRRAEDHPE